MPFIKNTGAKNDQPSINTQKIFIGRDSELQYFKDCILKPVDPMHNIVSIHGQGGVGKSALLAKYIDETHTTEFKDYCLTAMVSERQTTPISIMDKFADQLQMMGEFKKALNKYKETLRKLHVDGKNIQDAILRSVPDFAEAAGKSVPVAGPFAGVGVKVGAAYLLDKYHTAQIRRE
jgi:hypothetical protein